MVICGVLELVDGRAGWLAPTGFVSSRTPTRGFALGGGLDSAKRQLAIWVFSSLRWRKDKEGAAAYY
jgi:hypothetical protein